MSIQDNLYIFLVLYKGLRDYHSLSFPLCSTHLSAVPRAALCSKKQINKKCSQVIQTGGMLLNNNITNKRQINPDGTQQLCPNEYRKDSK